MIPKLCAAVAASALLILISGGRAAFAQKPGGILKMYVWDSPPSMSMLDGVNPLAQQMTMGVFNNLVMFDQHVEHSSLESIVPDLATGWSWNEEGTALTLPLRQGVKWHDGKPFTAKDVQCTWDLLLDKSSDKLRVNPIKSWYRNLEEVTTNGDYEVTFHLKRPQPAFLMLLANGLAPIYPCHVPTRDIRAHPIGTGPTHANSVAGSHGATATSRPYRKCAAILTKDTAEGMLDVHAVCVSPAAPDSPFLALRMGLFRGENRGAAWTDLNIGQHACR
jgi:peptide/nickel transport system substrate-binding protein